MSTDLANILQKTQEISEASRILSIQVKDFIMSESINATDNVINNSTVFAITIFVLSCFIGYYLVRSVTPSLHTPLMAVTNAISGVVIIGCIVAANRPYLSSSSILSLIAVFLSSINIFGGFILTSRMLRMFRKK